MACIRILIDRGIEFGLPQSPGPDHLSGSDLRKPHDAPQATQPAQGSQAVLKVLPDGPVLLASEERLVGAV